jgi:hypothetical protein
VTLTLPLAQLLTVGLMILLAAFANRSRGGGNTGVMIFGLLFLSVPALFAAAAFGWPGFIWGSVATLILMRVLS